MPSGDGRLDRAAEAEGGAAEEGAMDEAVARGGLGERAGAVQRARGNGRMDPMPSGGRAPRAGRFTAEEQRRRGGRASGCRCACWRCAGVAGGAIRQIPRKHPMPSGAAALQRGEERVHAAAIGSPGAAQGDHLGRIETVRAAGGSAAGAPLGCARAGAKPAMHSAAPVRHGRLATAFARAGPGAAARRGEEVAGRGTIPEPATAIRRQAGGGVEMGGHGNLLRFFHAASCNVH
jgi:hypothetical protein